MPGKIPPKNSPGDYRRKFAIQQRTTTKDTTGHETAVWTDFVNPIWGSRAVWKGSITLIAQQALTQVINIIEMRYRPGVTTAMRIVDLNQTPNLIFRIISVNDVDGRHEKLSFVAVEENSAS